jgi:phospholipase D1/2
MPTAYSISNTGKNGPVQNQIAKALVDRIIRAAQAGERFKVVVSTVAILDFPAPNSGRS